MSATLSLKIYTLIKNLLTHYQKKEMVLEQPHFKYYDLMTHNQNRLVFTSALSHVESLVVMHLFECLYEENDFMFRKEFLREIREMEEDCNYQDTSFVFPTSEVKQKMYQEYDLTTWITYLEKYENYWNEQDEPDEKGKMNDFYMNEVRITSIQPRVVGRHQKIYTLGDILALLPSDDLLYVLK